MTNRQRSRRSWHLAAGLLLAVLAQACGGGSGSSSSGPSGGRVALEFREVRAARAGLLPAGCSHVVLEVDPPGGPVFTITDASGPLNLRLTAGPHTLKGTLVCGARQFVATTTFTVPPGLQSVQVSLVFGDVQVQLTVQAGPGVSVSGPGIACPSDCTETYLNGTTVSLTATPANAVFSGACSGTGGCSVTMTGDRTVAATLGDGFIRVAIVDTLCGECFLSYQIFIDGLLVAEDLDVDEPAVTHRVSPGSHTVRALCFGGESENQESPRTVNVGPGETVNVTFESALCSSF